MGKKYLVYKVTDIDFTWYVAMSHKGYKYLLQGKDKLKRVIIKENLTNTEAYGFHKILVKLNR